jgi:hypothetical protein
MKRPYVIALIVLTVLTLLSLALNGVVIWGLLRAQQIALDARQTVQDTVTDARAIVAGVGDDTFSYTLKVQQEVPVEALVPLEEEVVVPIRATIPISTVVIIPINAGLLGTFDIDVPVRTMVPVSLDVAIPISHTVNIATTVLLDMEVPIEIPLAETPLVDYLEELDAGLGRLEEALERLEHKLANPFAGEE